MVKKIYEMEVDGKTVGFRFNMLAFGKTCEMEGCSLDELYQKLGLGKVKQDPSIVTLNNFFFCAAVNYAEGKNIPVDFTPPDVSDWLDFYGIENSISMMTEAFKVPVIKNYQALEKPGQ